MFWGSPLIRVNKRYSVRVYCDKTLWKAIPDTILRSSVANIKRNLKMTVFQDMGIESKLLNQIQWYWYHSLLRKMLYLMMRKKYDTLRSQGTENQPLRFFGLTPGIAHNTFGKVAMCFRRNTKGRRRKKDPKKIKTKKTPCCIGHFLTNTSLLIEILLKLI